MSRKFQFTLPEGDPRRPMVKSFIQSMGLLSIAMVIALYSASNARSGETLKTAAAAVAALGIAAWVGIRFVPQLARGVNWAWMPSLRKYEITRDGGIFAGAILVVLAAAINTSNNLLYMVLSALLAVVLLSILLSARNFKSLEMELLLPERAFAEETLPLSVRVHNRRQLFPAFSVKTQLRENEFYFPLIQPQTAALHLGETRFSRRGRHTIQKVRATSRFPFGFFVKAREYPVHAECICYPKILPLEELDISIRNILGSTQRMERGRGSDLYMIRDYQPFDSARHVHWKATAKTSALKTREFAADESPRFVLALDRYGEPKDAERFEELVSRAASFAFHLIGNGVEVSLVADDWQSPDDASEATLDAILKYLALVEMTPMAMPPAFDAEAGALHLSLRYGYELP